MTKAIAFLSLFVLSFTQSFAEDDSVKLTVGTQVFLCELTDQLNCSPASEAQEQEVLLKKNGGKILIEDKEHKLSAEITALLDNGNVAYDVSLCSSESCSLSTVTTNPQGSINQIMSGQYNITQKSFYILEFYITTDAGGIKFKSKILKKHAYGSQLRP